MAIESPRFEPDTNLVMACLISGVHDVNRNTTLTDDNHQLVKDWAESITAANLKGVIFHNNFSEETCKSFDGDTISFVKIAYDLQFNPNVFRYFAYRNFLQQNIQQIKGIFITDVTDVVLVKNPFTDPLFIENSIALFCGDEPKLLNNDWMIAHAENLRKNIHDYAEYESNFGDETLLNCGIIGGTSNLLLDFLQQLCAIHQHANRDNKTAYTGDMGAFNYLARTQFNSQLIHGAPVNAVFKEYENERNDCWFRHK
jgi:hypothetical protein